MKFSHWPGQYKYVGRGAGADDKFLTLFVKKGYGLVSLLNTQIQSRQVHVLNSQLELLKRNLTEVN